MVGRVGVVGTPTCRNEGDELVLHVDEVATAVTFLVPHHVVQNELCFSEIVDVAIVAPEVGGEEKRGDVIEFTIGSRTLSVASSVRSATPGEIALQVAILVLHIFLAPSPKSVEHVLASELHGNHHAIAHALGASIVVLHVGNVTHRIAHFEVDFVGTLKEFVTHLVDSVVNLLLRITQFGKDIAILACLHAAFVPRRFQLFAWRIHGDL